MGWFSNFIKPGSGQSSQGQSADEIASSIKSLEAGGLPLLAQRRLKAEAEDPAQRFTSDLSVNELLFARKSGYEPVSQVMGSSIYHVGWQYQPIYSSSELTVLTHAFWHVRSLALSRMQQEARHLGAHGVVGVHIANNVYEWAQGQVEFVAIGTAIRIPGAPKTETPFLSDLSGQDLWALHVNGFRPVGIAAGTCVWYQVASWATRAAQTTGYTGANAYGYGYVYGTGYMNQELTDFSQAVSHARRIACQRMEAEVQAFGGEGVVGVQIRDDLRPYEVKLSNDQERTDLVVRFQAMGTAIVHYEHGVVKPIDYSLPLTN